MAIKGSSSVTLVDLSDAYSVTLTSEAYTFQGNTTGAPAGLSCTTEIVSYCGNTLRKSSITASNITCPTGISATVSNNNTLSPTVTFKTTSTLTGSCEAIIPVVVDGITINKKFSFAVAKTGATGATGATGVSIFTLITNYSYTQSYIDEYSKDGYSGTWTVTSTSGVKVGDTVLLRLTNTTKNGYAFIIAKVIAVKSATSVTTTSMGLIDKGSTGPQGKPGIDFSQGKMLYTDPMFNNGTNGVSVYNNMGNGNVTISRTTKTNDNPISEASYNLVIANTGASSPALGGFYFGTLSRCNAIFIYRFIAWIPNGYTLCFASNSAGGVYSGEWLTSNVGDGNYREYVYRIQCGRNGSYSTTGYFYLDGTAGTPSNPVKWWLAYATCYDMTAQSDVISLNASLKVEKGNIAALASRTSSVEGRISTAESSIKQNAEAITMKVSKKDVLNQLNSELKITGNSIDLTTGHFTVNSTNLTITSDGTLTAKNGVFSGKLEAATGTFAGSVISDNIYVGNAVSNAAFRHYLSGSNGTIELSGSSGGYDSSVSLNSGRALLENVSASGTAKIICRSGEIEMTAPYGVTINGANIESTLSSHSSSISTLKSSIAKQSDSGYYHKDGYVCHLHCWIVPATTLITTVPERYRPKNHSVTLSGWCRNTGSNTYYPCVAMLNTSGLWQVYAMTSFGGAPYVIYEGSTDRRSAFYMLLSGSWVTSSNG